MKPRKRLSISPKNNSRKKKALSEAGLLGAILLWCLTGCEVGPNYRPPGMKLPATFTSGSPPRKQKTDANGADQSYKPVIDAANWWRGLHDQELNSLVARAIQNNFNIEIALDRMQEARTQEAVVTGMALPEAGFSAGGGRGSGSDLARGRAAEPLVSAENTGNLKQVTHIVGFAGGWELDLFGKFRREIEAAKYDTQAAIAARNDVLISVIADVTRSYVDMRGFQMELAVLLKNIDVAQQYLNLTQERFNRGITNELDVTLAQRQLATLQAERMPLVSQINVAQDVIAVLLGNFPEDSTRELKISGLIPSLPGKIAAGFPPTLLRRRPDIHEAERELASATARVGVATADLFPHVVLVGGAGMQGQGLGVTPASGSFIWSAGPAISWSLLDFGALDALVNVANLRTREMLANYKQTVLNAVEEVDTAISSYESQQDRLQYLTTALAASQRAVSLATERFDRGLTDSLNVIDAERQEFELEDQYVITQRTAAEQFIALYKALGGGWEDYQSFPPIRRPQPAIIAAFTRILSSDVTHKVQTQH
jgi:NodT family efflux transporter outer membrane factor (OMF) lipoprotein